MNVVAVGKSNAVVVKSGISIFEDSRVEKVDMRYEVNVVEASELKIDVDGLADMIVPIDEMGPPERTVEDPISEPASEIDVEC